MTHRLRARRCPRLTPAAAGARLLAISLVLVIAAAACGGDDGGSRRTPQASGTPAPTGAAGPVIDLSEAPRVLTAYGAGEGDFRSDQPGLATGDFNGDGLADILAGARFADGPEGSREDGGEAYIILGSRQLPEDVQLGRGQADVTVLAADAGDNVGISVAAGDVNDDGLDDALIGASTALRPRYPDNRTGAVYIVFGKTSLEGVVDFAEDQPDAMVIGPRNLSHFGDSLAAGDVNGDGIQDIIAGAPFAEEITGTGADAVYNTGAVYVVFGSPRLPGTVDLENGPADAFLVGAAENDEMGDEVAAGDVNGDGIDDIVAVAEAADGPGDTRDGAGEAYVFYGSPAFAGVRRVADGNQDVTVLGAEGADTLGFSVHVASLGGGAAGDIILGARLASGPDNSRPAAGEAYVIFGGTLPKTFDLAVDQPNVIVYGARSGDFLGTSLTDGDFDGDGASGLVVCADFASGPTGDRLSAGAAYVLPPLADGDVLDTAEGDERVLLRGARPGDRACSSAAAGDIDGDGRDELIITAQDAFGTGESGRVGQVIAVRAP